LRKSQGKQHEQSVELPLPADHTPLTISFTVSSVAISAIVILGILLGVWIVSQMLDKIILLLLGFFVAAIMDPGVRWMEKRSVPRGVAILIFYFCAMFIVMFLLVSLIPIIANQLQQIAILLNEQANAFIQNPRISLPLLTSDVNQRLTDIMRATLQNFSIVQFTDALQQFGQNLSSFAQGSVLFATKLAGSVIDFFVKLIVVLVLAFFIQIEKEQLRSWFRSFFSSRYRNYMDNKTDAMHQKIGQWARGQLLLGLSIGILVFVALTILRMPYAATLAVLAGMTEFIPYVGPLIAAIPAILIAVAQGGFLWALIVTGVYYIVQWCENNLLVPLIMKRAVGISPIAIMFAMLVGVSFPDIIHPILGLLLAVPVTTIITLFIEDWRTLRQLM
jgi:predicted PurR-regulated permease PerM